MADRRNRTRQKYCSLPECRRASKARSQAKWLGQPANQNYFKGSENVDRVRQWRAKNPGYWRRGKKRTARAQQENSKSQVTVKSDVNEVRSLVTQGVPLQDIWKVQEALIMGLIDMTFGGALQEDMEKTVARLQCRGQDLLGAMSGGRFNPQQRKTDALQVPQTSAPA